MSVNGPAEAFSPGLKRGPADAFEQPSSRLVPAKRASPSKERFAGEAYPKADKEVDRIKNTVIGQGQ